MINNESYVNNEGQIVWNGVCYDSYDEYLADKYSEYEPTEEPFGSHIGLPVKEDELPF